VRRADEGRNAGWKPAVRSNAEARWGIARDLSPHLSVNDRPACKIHRGVQPAYEMGLFETFACAKSASSGSKLMQQFPWTALVTLLALVVYLAMIIGVGRARGKYKITAPATTGEPAFERHFRVHMNTLESLPVFLPSLWLFASYWGDQFAAGIGAFWIAGRLLYWTSYVRDPRSRSLGFQIQGAASMGLLFGAFAGVVQVLIPALAH
jgi:glutathione S-transferase